MPTLPPPRRPRALHLSCLLGGALALSACASWQAAPPAPASAGPDLAYVVLGEQGERVARTLSAGPCPALDVDGQSQPMQMRAAAGVLPLRNTSVPDAHNKAAAFPSNVCELRLAPGVRQVRLHGAALPLPPQEVKRIVVLGDTGCRLRGAAVQDCNDATAWPFALVAKAAAQWKPDLVLHVGDYHYRETPCPEGRAGCKDSPYGFGEDVWRADFLHPARPLLAAAPWVMVRGNHESCMRGGQGWWRLLDPRPLLPGRDCIRPADDAQGDFSPVYATPLGGDAQVLVWDSSAAPHGLPPSADPRHARYAENYRQLDKLSNQATYNFMLSHHPLLGFYVEPKAGGKSQIQPGNPLLQQVFRQHNPYMLTPPRVQALLAGHVHTWQQLSFSSGHPSHFIAGHSGSMIDELHLPNVLPADTRPAPEAAVHSHASYGGYGFMTMEREGADRWKIGVYDYEGKLQRTCVMENRSSTCAP
ncbi:metallophosphoesterase [Massilia sp. W12]|uniref:metallophosphoesterase family protein n=1 Tax=Massilia sp. W12 TaxID=3126507 RepID=UPI0030CF94BA